MPFIKSLLLSILVYTFAIFFSYIDSGNILTSNVSASVILLCTSIIVSNDIQHIHLLGTGINNFGLMPLMSVMFVISMGKEEYLFYSLAMLFLAISFHVIINNSFSSEPIASELFKLLLLLAIFAFFFIKSLFLLPILVIMILFFRGPIAKDLLAIVISSISLFILALWFCWYFDYPLISFSSIGIRQQFFVSLTTPSLQSNLTLIVLGLIFLHSLIVKLYVVKSREVSDNIIGRIVYFVLVLIILSNLSMLALGGELKPYYISSQAIPYSIIVAFHLSSIKNSDLSQLLVFCYTSLAVLLFFSEKIASFHFFNPL